MQLRRNKYNAVSEVQIQRVMSAPSLEPFDQSAPCSKCSGHERRIMTMTIIIVEMVTDIENNDHHHGRTKESCWTLYWRFWLGKPGQRGVQIGFEKARAHIWALNARPPGYPMPHKAPAVMESDIEWYKAIHVFTGPLLMITGQTKNCFKQRASNEVVQAREGSRPRPNLHLQWLYSQCNAMIILNAMIVGLSLRHGFHQKVVN